jgi:drug/metabolite transporter (DMT)-like permease
MGYMKSAFIFGCVSFVYGCQSGNNHWGNPEAGILPFLACLLVGLCFVAGDAIVRRIRRNRALSGKSE